MANDRPLSIDCCITRTVNSIARARFIALVLVISASGCAEKPRPQFAPLMGTITYQGKPLSRGQIALVHASGRMGVGDVGPDGSYRMDAPLGECKVMITCDDRPSPSKFDPDLGRQLTIPRSLIPDRYRNYQTSGLKATIAEGANKQDWKLVD
jgi:hypothetical protein